MTCSCMSTRREIGSIAAYYTLVEDLIMPIHAKISHSLVYDETVQARGEVLVCWLVRMKNAITHIRPPNVPNNNAP